MTAPRRAKTAAKPAPAPRLRVVKTPKPKPEPASSSGKLAPDVLQTVFDQELLRLGLPASTPEYLFAKDIGRRWRIDRAWPEPLCVAVEIEGGVHIRGRHLRPAGFLADMDKYNELALRGWLLVRVTYDMIADGRARDLVLRALAARSTRATPREIKS